MFIFLVRLGLFALCLGVAYLLVRKWQKLDLEAKVNEVKEIEDTYKTVEEIEKHHPDYQKKKAHIEKFLSK